MTPFLDVRGVRKSYGRTVALDGVDLAVGEGTILGLLGPNGAGKTSLVSIVAGLRRPDAGTVHVAGIDVTREPGRARSLIGFAP
ncbi:MAG TPA: ATP-binding cassette domain-containing protein, partial [Acidimicrobiia bacterium]|nr:ATP-binding cassette domain-containing protein [Acidimicrobiia bacterium]